MNIFAALQARLNYVHQRQEVIASNIANVDTPNYKSRDLAAPKTFQELLGGNGMRMATTNAQHISASQGGGSGRFRTMAGAAFETLPNGNSVSLEQEMLKASQNTSENAMLTNLYRRSMNLLRLASTKGSA